MAENILYYGHNLYILRRPNQGVRRYIALGQSLRCRVIYPQLCMVDLSACGGKKN
ncbi:MAG: hypothetical protein JW947_09725 [Sedimentisphaerales bacterium]|nr:hypothetical protein [Sedimentisphaerales bacterium]